MLGWNRHLDLDSDETSDYETSTDPDLSGDHPLIKYYTAYSILDHSLGFTSTVGGMQPLVAWDSLSSTIQEALADKDWGS